MDDYFALVVKQFIRRKQVEQLEQLEGLLSVFAEEEYKKIKDEFEIERVYTKDYVFQQIYWNKRIFYIGGVTRLRDGSLIEKIFAYPNDSLIVHVIDDDEIKKCKKIPVQYGLYEAAELGCVINYGKNPPKNNSIRLYDIDYPKLLSHYVFNDIFDEKGIVEIILNYLNLDLNYLNLD